MLTITLRTDKPEAEIGLYEGNKKLDYINWAAHRELAETINQKIDNMLSKNDKTLKSINCLVVYKGPGSFTGLRIGLSVANALAYSNELKIIGTTGMDWIEDGINQLLKNKNDKVVIPEYGSALHYKKSVK